MKRLITGKISEDDLSSLLSPEEYLRQLVHLLKLFKKKPHSLTDKTVVSKP